MFRDLLGEAYAAMRHNRRRTALTMLGMAWGIATVVMLLAYGDWFRPGLREHLCELRHQARHRRAGQNFHAGGRSEIGSANPIYAG